MREVIKFAIKIMALIIYPIYLLYNLLIEPLIERIKLELIILKLKSNNAQIAGRLNIGKRVNISVGKNAKLVIGDKVFIGDDVYVKVRSNATLIIGDQNYPKVLKNETAPYLCKY